MTNLPSLYTFKHPPKYNKTCIKHPSIRASKNLVNYSTNLLKINKTINNGWDCIWIIGLFVNPRVSLHTSTYTKIMKTYNHKNVKIHNYFWVSKITIPSIPDLVKNYACVHAWTNTFHINISSVNYLLILGALTRTKVQQFSHSPDNTFAALSRYETHEHLGLKISPLFQMFFAKLWCLLHSSSHKQIL